jgi:hypothetical protein
MNNLGLIINYRCQHYGKHFIINKERLNIETEWEEADTFLLKLTSAQKYEQWNDRTKDLK